MSIARLPLDGIKVVELCHWVLGPSCCRILGELGADVVKIENPAGGDPARGLRETLDANQVNPLWQLWNGSKRSIGINLQQEAGKEIACKLIEKADVVVTNFSINALEKLGLDYENIVKINPRIIYAQATGFGTRGPSKDRMAFDNTAFWVRSGIMSTLGEPDGPPVPLRGAMGDLTAAVFLTAAITSALLARDRFGFGQKVETSLMSAGMWLAGDDIQYCLTFGDSWGNTKYSRKTPSNPLRNTYQTKDQKWLILHMVQTDRWWPTLCKAIEREYLAEDPRFDSHDKRLQNSESIVSLLDKVLATKTIADWAEIFEKYGLVWEPETSVSEVLADPQVTENSYVAQLNYPPDNPMKLLNIPIQFSRTTIQPRYPAPELGQHTEEVLIEIGYDWGQISQLKQQKIII